MEDLRRQLRRLHALVASCESAVLAAPIREAFEGPEEALRAYLVSNELWGGSGSVADQSGTSAPAATRRGIEKRLIELGDMQAAAGIVNPRTVGWVQAFRAAHGRGT